MKIVCVGAGYLPRCHFSARLHATYVRLRRASSHFLDRFFEIYQRFNKLHSLPSILSFFLYLAAVVFFFLFSSQVEFIYLYLLISKRAALLFSQWTAYYVIFLCLSLKYLRFSHCLALPCASSIAIALLGDGPGVAFRSTLPRIATAADVTSQLPALHAAQSHLRTHEPWRHSATPRGTYMHWRLYIPSHLTHNNNNIRI